MPSCSPGIERAKPLLGTRVAVRVHGLAPEEARVAIDAAFAEIATVHALMSFHEIESDVSRLNRHAHLEPVTVDRRTYEVLEQAQTIAAASDGAFDITVAPDLVARSLLPQPDGTCVPDPTAIWRDIALLPNHRVYFRRPLWIDLGGIAKGYAVDRAVETLLAFSPTQACVNAGGDLRLLGCESERVQLRADHHDPKAVPIVEICGGSLASSSGRMAGRRLQGMEAGPHVDTLKGHRRSAHRFVCVMAPRCMDADALTKVVMARGACSRSLLLYFDAWAVLHDEEFGWREIAGRA